MRAVIVYESMFGNTRTIAERIGEGMRKQFDVKVVPVDAATADVVDDADVVIVGGPTHAHGLPFPGSRKNASEMAAKDGSDVVFESHATDTGLREWFAQLGAGEGRFAAAFDTRATGPAFFTGKASHGIARRLRHHGFHIGAVKSFLVKSTGHLVDGEADRATLWGESVASVAAVGLREHPRSSAV